MKKAKVENKEPIYLVSMNGPKKNKMFTERQHALTLFLTYSQAIPCAECGRRSKHHWTQRCTFVVMQEVGLMLKRGEKVHMPLAPVCTKHILAEHPEMEEGERDELSKDSDFTDGRKDPPHSGV